LKIDRIMPFCNLFMGRPSYYLLSYVYVISATRILLFMVDIKVHALPPRVIRHP